MFLVCTQTLTQLTLHVERAITSVLFVVDETAADGLGSLR